MSHFFRHSDNKGIFFNEKKYLQYVDPSFSMAD